MNITIKGMRENEDSRTVYFILKKGSKEYKFHADIPKEEEAQVFLDSRKDEIHNLILGKIKKKTFMDNHPIWIDLDGEIDALPPQFNELKPILKQLAREEG